MTSTPCSLIGTAGSLPFPAVAGKAPGSSGTQSEETLFTVRTRAPVCVLGDASALRRLASQTRGYVPPPRMARRQSRCPTAILSRSPASREEDGGRCLADPGAASLGSLVPTPPAVTVEAGYSAPEE